ncbi:hypothetical protein T492DRAFT_1104119 [Pavlovales sp. CCMP2436]|nr:hypothetical protein T492DRAFT_1104119 [Pavlovales sp. CCMP2436]
MASQHMACHRRSGHVRPISCWSLAAPLRTEAEAIGRSSPSRRAARRARSSACTPCHKQAKSCLALGRQEWAVLPICRPGVRDYLHARARPHPRSRMRQPWRAPGGCLGPARRGGPCSAVEVTPGRRPAADVPAYGTCGVAEAPVSPPEQARVQPVHAVRLVRRGARRARRPTPAEHHRAAEPRPSSARCGPPKAQRSRRSLRHRVGGGLGARCGRCSPRWAAHRGAWPACARG